MSYHMHLCWKWFESRNQTWGFYHRCKVSSWRRNDEEREGNFAQGAKDDDFQTALITLEWILKCKENLKSQLLSGKYSLTLFSGALFFINSLPLLWQVGKNFLNMKMSSSEAPNWVFIHEDDKQETYKVKKKRSSKKYFPNISCKFKTFVHSNILSNVFSTI